MPQGKARRAVTDGVMDAIAELSGQERADAYNEVPAPRRPGDRHLTAATRPADVAAGSAADRPRPSRMA